MRWDVNKWENRKIKNVYLVFYKIYTHIKSVKNLNCLKICIVLKYAIQGSLRA